MKKKIILIAVTLPLIIGIIVVGIKYNNECLKYRSEVLENRNLKGFVKSITCEDAIFANNFELYDYLGKELMTTNSTISVQVTYDGSGNKSLIMQNYFICNYEIDSLDNDNYKYFFESKRSLLKNTIDINLKNNPKFDEFNVSEEDFLIIELTKNDKVFKTYTVNSNYETSDYNCYSYSTDMKKIIDCKTQEVKRIYKYKNGKVVESVYESNSNMFPMEHKEIGYFDEGLIMKNRLFDKNGKCWRYNNYKYDKNRNVILENLFIDRTISKYNSEFTLSSEVTKSRSTKYSYLYDQNNNWIEKTIFHHDGKETVIKRQIEYYEFSDFLKNIF